MGMKKDIIKVCAKANFLLQISSSSTIVDDYGKSCLAGKAMNYKGSTKKAFLVVFFCHTYAQDMQGDPYSQIPSSLLIQCRFRI